MTVCELVGTCTALHQKNLQYMKHLEDLLESGGCNDKWKEAGIHLEHSRPATEKKAIPPSAKKVPLKSPDAPWDFPGGGTFHFDSAVDENRSVLFSPSRELKQDDASSCPPTPTADRLNLR